MTGILADPTQSRDVIASVASNLRLEREVVKESGQTYTKFPQSVNFLIAVYFSHLLGKSKARRLNKKALLLGVDIPHRPFGKAVLDCLLPEGERWVVPPKRDSDPIWRDREDFRQLNICSIDPPGAYAKVI